MAQETNQSPVPMLCATGCGFYGNPRTNGMCSVCHKEHLSRQNNGGMSSMGAMGGGGVSLGSAAEAASSRRRLEATLNAVAAAEAEAAAVAAAEDAAAEAAAATAEAVASEVLSSGVTSLSVTRQMSRLSLSAGDCGTSARQEPPEPVVTQPTAGASPLGAVGGGGDGSELTELTELLKPKKNRCFMCRKKVGLTGFGCRCGNLFCGGHRYSDKHNCPYDYKAEAAAKIRKDNPVVVADKIQRI